MGVKSETALTEAYKLIETSQVDTAKQLLDDVLSSDLDNNEIVFLIRCCAYWSNIFTELRTLDPFEQGETLISSWHQFSSLLENSMDPLERASYAFTRCVFSYALEQYRQISEEKNLQLRSLIHRRMGLCFKRLGSYDEALSCLSEANSSFQGQAVILAEMADCYDLCGNSKSAKVLFREAFFIDAEKVDLTTLDSPIIKNLCEKVSKEGYANEELQEWIPVYGILLGVFNVKRLLRSQEIGKLKQDITAKENELKDPANNAKLIKPRLMTKYLWLMDYYLQTKESLKKINEILLKIKVLDPEIYRRFFNYNDTYQ